jgi:hypothetical protein
MMMKTQYLDPLKTHPNFLAFGKALAESGRLSDVTFAATFASTWSIPQDNLGSLDGKFGVEYWLRLLVSGQYKWLVWQYDNGSAYSCWKVPGDDAEDDQYVMVDLTTAGWDLMQYPESSFQKFCKGTTLKTIKGQPTQPTSPPRNTLVTEPSAPKKPRKRPAKTDADTVPEPEPKKLVV